MMEGKALGEHVSKDTHALFKEAESKKVTLEVLRSAINRNNKIRKEYPDLIGREHDQILF